MIFLSKVIRVQRYSIFTKRYILFLFDFDTFLQNMFCSIKRNGLSKELFYVLIHKGMIVLWMWNGYFDFFTQVVLCY
jgi:hypothetical protein